MQALSIWPSKGEFWAVSQFEVELESFYISSKRRRKRWDLGGYSGSLGICFVSTNSGCGRIRACLGHGKMDLRCGVFSGGHRNCRALLFCYPNKGSFGGFALGWAPDPHSVGNEFVEENSGEGMSDGSKKEGVGCLDMKVSCKKDDNEHKLDLEGKMATKEKGRKVDVRALGFSLASAKTANDVQVVLKDQDELPLQVYSTLIKSFGKDKKLDPAMALVEWLEQRKQETGGVIAPNLFVYNSLLGAVKQSGRYEQVEKVMNAMAAEGVLPSVVTYNTLMGIYLEQGRNAEALNLLDEIQSKGLSPSPASYSTALLAYQRAEDGFGALNFFVQLREKYEVGDIKKNADEDWDNELAKLEDFIIRICYQVMRTWLVKGYDESSSTNVLKLLTHIDNAGLQFGRAEYERLIWACTQEKHYTVVKELYKRIRERHSQISLSVCNHAIWLMGKAKKWWAALEIYEDLLDKGPNPNNLSYELIVSHFNVLLTAARKRGIWRWGIRLLNRMEDKGIKPSDREWNAVLVACSKASETTAAVEIFKRMIEKGEKPTIVSYGALLSALEKGSLYDEAFRVWDHMIRVGVEPNVHAYTIMASVCIGQGKVNLVDSIIQEMVSSGINPTVVTYNAIISGCARKGMSSVAFEWFHRMKVQDVEPNKITYEMLIEALTKDGKPRLAYELYLRAQNQGLSLCFKAYDAVIQSSQSHDASIDLDVLGPPPPEKKKKVQI